MGKQVSALRARANISAWRRTDEAERLRTEANFVADIALLLETLPEEIAALRMEREEGQ